MKKVYIAGPAVFSNQAQAFYNYFTSLCREYGFTPLIPWISGVLPAPETIYQRNVEMLRLCDGCVAQLNPFHGTVEPDSGTVWEIGFLAALGKPVVGYMSPQQSIEERTRAHWRRQNHHIPERELLMPDGNYVENFGYPQNLMIQSSLVALKETLADAMTVLEGEFTRLDDFARMGTTT